jgi:hypothetical protein
MKVFAGHSDITNIVGHQNLTIELDDGTAFEIGPDSTNTLRVAIQSNTLVVEPRSYRTLIVGPKQTSPDVNTEVSEAIVAELSEDQPETETVELPTTD